jgi:hypothetical protein
MHQLTINRLATKILAVTPWPSNAAQMHAMLVAMGRAVLSALPADPMPRDKGNMLVMCFNGDPHAESNMFGNCIRCNTKIAGNIDDTYVTPRPEAVKAFSPEHLQRMDARNDSDTIPPMPDVLLTRGLRPCRITQSGEHNWVKRANHDNDICTACNAEQACASIRNSSVPHAARPINIGPKRCAQGKHATQPHHIAGIGDVTLCVTCGVWWREAPEHQVGEHASNDICKAGQHTFCYWVVDGGATQAPHNISNMRGCIHCEIVQVHNRSRNGTFTHWRTVAVGFSKSMPIAGHRTKQYNERNVYVPDNMRVNQSDMQPVSPYCGDATL